MRTRLALTMGDPAGIGPEVTVRALAEPAVYERAIPVVYGDAAPLQDALRFLQLEDSLRLNPISRPEEALGEFGVVDVISHGLIAPAGWTYGQNSALCGDAAFQYVVHAIRDAMNRQVSGVVTAPISKEAIRLAGHAYCGHTEILAAYTGVQDYAMLLCAGPLRVIHVTTHVSMQEACSLITKERVGKVIRLAQQALQELGLPNGRIGLAGFNAHCSENGLFGTQEAEAIHPAVLQAQAEGIAVEGPIPADTIFTKAAAGLYDVVVAMYHDQGHIPVKLMGFRMDAKTNTFTGMSGINCTIGLPIVRTSVDHGTAFDRAGQGTANGQSMAEAIQAAVDMARARGL